MFGMPPKKGLLFSDDEENSPFKPQGPAAPWSGMPPVQPPAAPVGNTPFYKDKDKMAMMLAALSNGFGNMTLRGNRGLSQVNNAIMGRAMENQKNNKTLALLKAQNPKLYEMAKNLPPEYLGEFMQQHIKSQVGGPQFRTNTSGVQIDEATGRKFVVESDGYGNSTVKFLEDADGNPLTGDTLETEGDATVRAYGRQQALDVGKAYYQQAESLQRSNDMFKQASQAIDNGARSGLIDSALPALDAQTQMLRSLANSAGIEVINSATFGALSEKELALAMSTGIPINLQEEDLQQYLSDKLKAQQKLKDQIELKARNLLSGEKTLGEWMVTWSEQSTPESYDDSYATRWDVSKTEGITPPPSTNHFTEKDLTDDDDDDSPAPVLGRRRSGYRDY